MKQHFKDQWPAYLFAFALAAFVTYDNEQKPGAEGRSFFSTVVIE